MKKLLIFALLTTFNAASQNAPTQHLPIHVALTKEQIQARAALKAAQDAVRAIDAKVRAAE